MRYLNILLLLSLFFTTLFAKSGEEIFENKCEKCHVKFIPMGKLKENFIEYNNTKLKLKAPTLNMLSFRLKEQIGSMEDDREFHQFQVVEFIKSYVKDPDPKKSLCMDKVLRLFHTMHSMKNEISDEDLQKVAEFIYKYDLKDKKSKNSSKEYEALFNRAKSENKIVLIKAESEYCHYCKKMEKEILSSKEVRDLIKRYFIDIKVDVYKQKLPFGLNVMITPSFIFIDKNRKVIKIVKGSWKKSDFITILKNVIKKER